ncbi:hypothetical protein YC2023_004991 [Brassica napus]
MTTIDSYLSHYKTSSIYYVATCCLFVESGDPEKHYQDLFSLAKEGVQKGKVLLLLILLTEHTHTGMKFVKSTWPSKKKEKYDQDCIVKGRNEPCLVRRISARDHRTNLQVYDVSTERINANMIFQMRTHQSRGLGQNLIDFNHSTRAGELISLLQNSHLVTRNVPNQATQHRPHHPSGPERDPLYQRLLCSHQSSPIHRETKEMKKRERNGIEIYRKRTLVGKRRSLDEKQP